MARRRKAASPASSVGDIPLREPDLPVHHPSGPLSPGDRENLFGVVPRIAYPRPNESLPHDPYGEGGRGVPRSIPRKNGSGHDYS
jgi:hypothetical protein